MEKGPVLRFDEVYIEFKRVLRACTGYLLFSMYLLPLATAAITARFLSPLGSAAMKLIEVEHTRKGAETDERSGSDVLVIPAPVLHNIYRMLRTRGGEMNEWIVALGCQEITGKKVVVHAYDLNCTLSTPTSAETDYGSLDRALDFYESVGARIVGLAHIHPWNSPNVHPSRIDIETQRRWEEYYGGEFIGIVFSNSGVFRIFHGGKSRLRTEILGSGVKKRGDGLYELELARK